MKYSYTIILGISLCGVLACSHVACSTLHAFGGMAEEQWSDILNCTRLDTDEEKEESLIVIQGEQRGSELAAVKEAPVEEIPAKETLAEETSSEEIPVEETSVTETSVQELPEEEISEPVSRETYFDDALFIGDSRTVGLFEYADMGKADAFADEGMSIYKINKAEISMGNRGKMNLETVLTQKQYGKIYLMLGINELGYDQNQTVRRYKELATYIHSLQPDAEMILEANMHVSGKKSARDKLYNNGNINAFNDQVRLLAEQEGWRYLNVNERFDDENGNLDASYTADDAHLLGKYYEEWAEWIYQKAND